MKFIVRNPNMVTKFCHAHLKSSPIYITVPDEKFTDEDRQVMVKVLTSGKPVGSGRTAGIEFDLLIMGH